MAAAGGAGEDTAAAGRATDAAPAPTADGASTTAVLEGVLETVASSRTVAMKVESREQAEGMGARVRRSIGGAKLRNLDPFLMLDEFKVAPPAGFPDHPHRGFETVTYMLEGSFLHEDFCGHKGTIGPGDLQWMTAGRGIVHCEMPAEKRENVGLQLWVNLAAKDKLCEPRYQELLARDIPKVAAGGVVATVIAGKALGVESPVQTKTPTYYLDFTLEPGAVLPQPVPEGWNSFAYVLKGSAQFGPEGSEEIGPAHHTVVFSNDDAQDGIRVRAGDEGCRLVILAGKPLNEPIVQHGPFVMNKQDEIMEAMMDYQFGRNGFERAPGFVSDAVKARGGR